MSNCAGYFVTKEIEWCKIHDQPGRVCEIVDLEASLAKWKEYAEKLRERLDMIAVLTQNQENPQICRIALKGLELQAPSATEKP